MAFKKKIDIQNDPISAVTEIIKYEIQTARKLLIFIASLRNCSEYPGFSGLIGHKTAYILKEHPEWLQDIYKILTSEQIDYSRYNFIATILYDALHFAVTKNLARKPYCFSVGMNGYRL